MTKVIPAYIYMRHYQVTHGASNDNFFITLRKCYEKICWFYTKQFLEKCDDPYTNEDSAIAYDIMKAMLIIRINAVTDYNEAHDDGSSFITSVDSNVATYYHRSQELQKLHPRLAEYFLQSK